MRSRRARREAVEAYLYLLPWFLGMVFITGGPLVAGLALGFTDWRGSGQVAPRFVALQNFQTMLTGDARFFQALRVTFTYAVATLVLSGLLSLGVALLMNQNLPGMHLFRTLYYVPVVVSAVAMSIVWAFVSHRDFGVLNYVLDRLVGIQGPDWLGSQYWALPSVILMSLWGIGGPMVILLAGLRGIPRELYEAAMVDGAGWRHRLISVTLPMLSPTLFFNLVTGIIFALQLFTQVYILTNGGPNFATYFYAYHIYVTAFQDLRVGYASALAIVMLMIILGLTLLTFRTSGRWVYYAGEVEAEKAR
jgi:multiple sugar transport system permease protein